MDYTRVDTKKLIAAVAEAEQHLEQAWKALAPFLAVLTDDARAAIPRPPATFPDAARSLGRAAAKQPEIAAVVGFDAEAVSEDLDNAATITSVAEKAAELSRLVADTRLQWLGEAWVPSLALYAVAKVKAKTDGALRPVVEPLAAVFAARRSRTKKNDGPAER